MRWCGSILFRVPICADKPVRGIHHAQAHFIRGKVHDNLINDENDTFIFEEFIYVDSDAAEPGFDELPQQTRAQQQD